MARTKKFDEKVILKKALDLFWHQGYNGTSAQNLVDGLGISRSSLYDTFGDKRSLFIKSLSFYRKETSNAMIAMIKESEDINITLKQIFDFAISESIQDKLKKGCFMVNTTVELAPHDKEIAQLVQQNMLDIENALLLAIEKGQKDGVINSSHNPKDLAHFLYTNIVGLRVVSKSNVDKKVYQSNVKIALSVLHN